MKLLSFALMSVFCTLNQAITFSTIATVSLTLISMQTPVSCFFGVFRRRKSPPIQETAAIPEPKNPFSPGQSMSGGFFNQFGFGGNGMFPGFNSPFGMFGQNRFQPQFRPPQMKPPQRQPTMQFPSQQQAMQFPSQQQAMQFPSQQQAMQFPSQQQAMQFPSQSFQPGADFNIDDFRDPRGEDVPGMNTEEAESFFTLLSETDESKCISRLVCEMGANPESGGEFGQTIADIIGSLNDFPDGSKVSEYNEVLNIGVAEGLSACMSKFSICDEESYQLVKTSQAEDSQS